MKKGHVIVLLMGMICYSESALTCPCGISTTDKRPFFEQYEAEASTTKQEDADNDEDSKKTQEEIS